MIRICKLSGQYYGYKIDLRDQDDIVGIKVFIGEGTPVLLVDRLEDCEEFNISPEEVVIVKPE